MRPILSTLISSLQVAFQRDAVISENIRLVQDVIEYCDREDRDGILLFCDQDSAYPRVELPFLRRVMHTMNLHQDFIGLVDCMYNKANVKVKVNGHVDDIPYEQANGLHQGCCLSPILYLLHLQSFLSLLDTAGVGGVDGPRLHGIEIPADSAGSNSVELKVASYADDMCCFLRDADQLPTFRSLLHIYEQGSGARNSWPKTHMLRVGALRDSDYLPPGWVDSKDEVAGQTSVDCSGAVIRYLGIFLGAPEQVARKWHERVTQKMERRMTEWAQRGMPRTREGRNVVTKNSVFACAWFMVQNQTPPNLEHMLEVWYQQEWGFIEASLASSLHDGKRSPKVKCGVCRRP